MVTPFKAIVLGHSCWLGGALGLTRISMPLPFANQLVFLGQACLGPRSAQKQDVGKRRARRTLTFLYDVTRSR